MPLAPVVIRLGLTGSAGGEDVPIPTPKTIPEQLSSAIAKRLRVNIRGQGAEEESRNGVGCRAWLRFHRT